MHWSDIIHHANEAGKQATLDKVNSKIDPKIQLEQAVESAKNRCASIDQNATNVVAQQKLAEMRLTKVTRDLAAAEENAKFAAQQALAAGETKENPGRLMNQALLIANDVASKRQEMETNKQFLAQADEAAKQAHVAVQEAHESLQMAIQNSHRLEGKMDMAKLAKAQSDSMASLTNATNTLEPTMDSIEERINSEYATATSSTELQSESNPEIASLELHHAALQAQGANILDELLAPATLALASTAADKA